MILLKGNVVASCIGLVNTMLLVNAIGLEANGIIFMAQAYAMLFNTLFNFQSYNAIIMFVPRVIKEGKDKVVCYLKQGFFLDFSTAFLGIIIAAICVKPIGWLMKWDSEITKYVWIYLVVIIFKTTGTMNGILRIYNKFNESVYINIIEALVRCILFIIGIVTKQGFLYFLIAEIACVGVGMICYIIFTWITLKEQNLKFRKIKFKLDKEFFKFNLYSNLESALDLPLVHITPFIINSTLGFSDIAVFKIIEKLGTLIAKVTSPINQAIFPDLSEKIADGNIQGVIILHKKIKKIIVMLGSATIILAIVTVNLWLGLLIPVTITNVIALVIYLVYIVYTNMFMAIHPIFTFLGYIKKNIPIITIANIVYLILIVPLANGLGVIGVMISKIIQAIIVISMKENILKRNNYKVLTW